MTHKIVISKATKDAVAETNPDNLVFSSAYDTLKYETVGSITVTVDLSDYYYFQAGSPPFFPDTYFNRKVETVAHGLGYTPYFSGYTADFPSAGSDIQLPLAFGDAGFIATESLYADSTYLYFVVQFNTTDNSGTIDFDYTYRIFKNHVNI